VALIGILTSCQTNKETSGFLSSTTSDNSISGKILPKTDLLNLHHQLKKEKLVNFLENPNKNTLEYETQILLDSSLMNHTRYASIYERLHAGDNTIIKYLKAFDSDFSPGHLRLSVDNDFQTNNPEHLWDAIAITFSPNPESKIIEVVFNNGDHELCEGSAQKLPKIVLAQAFIHELLHAEIYRKMISIDNSPLLKALSKEEGEQYRIDLMNNFPGIWDFYLRFEWNTEAPSSSAQHELMAARYINVMAKALADYDMNRHDESFYRDLSWTGLLETSTWSKINVAEKNRTLAVIRTAYKSEPFDD
jgi:hypothetical protein